MGWWNWAAAFLLGVRDHLRAVARGLAFLVAGFLVADIPWDNNIGSTTLFGAAFAIDGCCASPRRWSSTIRAGGWA